MLDKILLENTLFELYESTTYNNTKIALDDAIDKVVGKLSRTNGEPTKKQLEDLKATIESYISNGYKNTFDDMKEEITDVSGLTYDYMLLDVAAKGIPTSVVNDLLSSGRNIQGYDFGDLFKLTEDNHKRALKVALASGVSQGLSLPNLVKSILEKHDGITKGQLKTNIYTTITDSRENARYKSYEKFEAKGLIKGYEDVATLDFKTSKYCQSIDGQKRYGSIKDIGRKPLYHFNCRTKLVPITKNEFSTGKRASKFGEVSKDLNYEQWFNSIDDATKQKFMTPIKYKAYKNGLFNVKNVADLKKVGKKLDLKDVDSILKEAKTIPKIDFGYDGKFNKYVEDIRDEAKIVIDKLPKPNNIIYDKKEAFFRQSKDTINAGDDRMVFLHEYGHSIDDKLYGYFVENKFIREKDNRGFSSLRLLDKAASDDKMSIKAYDDDVLKGFADKWYTRDSVYYKSGKKKGLISHYIKVPIEEKYRYFSDIMDSMSDGRMFDKFYTAGHGSRYYKLNKYNRQTENFANLFALWSDTKNWNEAKELFPNLTNEFENIMKEVVDGKFD